MTTTVTTQAPHLARLRLNGRSSAVHHDLGDAGRLHRRVQSMFPDTTNRTVTHTLYRLERDPAGPVLLVQSTIPLNSKALPNRYTEAVEHRDLAPLFTWITTGLTLRYRIDANPIHAPRAPNTRQRGTRVPLLGEEAIAWWERKAAAAGLHAQLILDTPQQPLRANRGTTPDGKPARPACVSIIRFEGIATVTDPDALRTAITTGIGQGRAFGAGLLSIAPHRP
ncbi:type I-E CRISPR-associated protein Cas6/Cse3/CasE [Streptacidiphilus sp. N1-10]|uniref:Type I-E CRISPR-associated protein Cas6/Cse3/CasE n=1 Tax=Streptacidiphilus jeojiensis TaxID=3229225 RepID=A0ABV6XY14_9ACTN